MCFFMNKYKKDEKNFIPYKKMLVHTIITYTYKHTYVERWKVTTNQLMKTHKN